MRNFYLALIIGAVMPLVGQAQLNPVDATKTVKHCYTVEAINEARAANSRIESDAQFESWLNSRMAMARGGQVNTNYTIPVVFHVIHNGTAVGTGDNIAQAAIQQQLLQLNKDYANLSNSTYGVAASTGLQFVLAQKDPGGINLAEAGIDRIDRSAYLLTDYSTSGWSISYVTSSVKPSTTWDASRYLNIWIIPKMNDGGANEILGYATFPGSSGLTGLDNSETASTAGIAIETLTVGSVFSPNTCSTNPYGLGRTLSHEAGHFFGLRHIWGDTNCGTDYCNDTPVHQSANSGVPVHPKSNSCGTADEMFENYMDYSDDQVSNTFTADQVARMQTVMLNSPRRGTLATSNVGFVPVTASNKIAFNICSGAISVSETGITGSTQRYRDINLMLNVEGQATGAATVTLNLGGTAVNNVDYQVVTPSPVAFTTGDAYKPVTVRVIDNAAIDGDRTIVLSYSISGTGVTAGTTAQTMTITISDDDNVRIGQNTINLLSESFETAGGAIPTGWSRLSTASYVNPFVVSANGDAGGSGQCAHITNNTTTKPNVYTKGASGAAVLQTMVIDPTTVQAMGSLSFKYKIRGRVGSDNAYLTYTYSNQLTGPFYYWGSTTGIAGYGPYAGASTISGNPVLAVPTDITNKKFTIDFYWQTGTIASGGDPGLNIDDVVLTATPYGVESAVSNSYSYALLSGSNVNNIRSTNRKIVTAIKNVNQNISGVVASVTEAGVDRPNIVTFAGTYARSRKVITLTPAVANSSVTYTATFYFTAAEVSGWANPSSLKLLKVNDGVNPTGNIISTSNAVIVTPVVDDKLSTDGYVAYTGTFTGFSQFMLVDGNVVLPLQLLGFTGTMTNDVAKLNWKTTSEVNTSGFEVQKSTDGSNFSKIGWVLAANIPGTNNYSFDDNNISKGVQYFYRLKMVDIDGRFTYSNVINLSTRSNGITITPNPFKDKLVINGNGATAKKTAIIVTDASGRVVYKTQVNLYGTFEVNTTNWSTGMYLIKVADADGSSTFNVIKN
jgi:zinc-dependent metalloproteinase lipoprotein